MKEIDKIAFIEIRDGKLLFTRSKGKAKFYIPGGKREPGETDEEALIREIAEEICVDIIPDTAQYIGTFTDQADEKSEGVLVKMACYTAGYNGQPLADNEIEEIKWLNSTDRSAMSRVSQKILDYLVEKGEIN